MFCNAHLLIRSGPYRLVRHPLYTGLIVAALKHSGSEECGP